MYVSHIFIAQGRVQRMGCNVSIAWPLDLERSFRRARAAHIRALKKGGDRIAAAPYAVTDRGLKRCPDTSWRNPFGAKGEERPDKSQQYKARRRCSKVGFDIMREGILEKNR